MSNSVVSSPKSSRLNGPRSYRLGVLRLTAGAGAFSCPFWSDVRFELSDHGRRIKQRCAFCRCGKGNSVSRVYDGSPPERLISWVSGLFLRHCCPCIVVRPHIGLEVRNRPCACLHLNSLMATRHTPRKSIFVSCGKIVVMHYAT